jgi:hypothetical protein
VCEKSWLIFQLSHDSASYPTSPVLAGDHTPLKVKGPNHKNIIPPMTTTFNSLYGGFDCTPGKAVIDMTTEPLRKLIKNAAALERKAHKRLAGCHSRPMTAKFVLTQPPPLTRMPEPPVAARPLTEPATPDPQTLEQRFQTSMQIIARDYPRIHGAIASSWGHRECSRYIQNLILSGGDGMGNNRVGFKVGTVAALMLLDELHDTQFRHNRP